MAEIKTTKISEKADKYYKKYKPYMDLFEKKSVVAQVNGGITEDDVYSLGEQLERFEDYMKFCEADGSKNDLGVLPTIALDVITAANAQSPIPLICSTQPIDNPKGLIYYKKIIAETSRGNVTAGQALTDARQGRLAIENGYASEEIFNEDTGAAGDGSTTDFAFKLKYPPINLRSVTIRLASGTVKAIDDGEGNILGVGVQGTINYQTGAVTLTFATAPAKGDKILADYASNFEAMNEIPTIRSEYDSLSVNARTYALRTSIGLFKSYEMSKRFGINVEEQIARDLTQELTVEVANNVVMKAYLNAQGVVTWNKQAPSGVSYTEHKLTFFDALADAESMILNNAGRLGSQIALIAGNKAAAVIKTLPGFKPAANINAIMGTHLLGQLENRPVIRSMSIPTDEIIVVTKTNGLFDASLVYAPYLPLFVTNTMDGVDHNPLKSQKGAAISAAIEAPVPFLITKIKIENA